MARFSLCILLLLAVMACQTGGTDTEGTLNSAAGEQDTKADDLQNEETGETATDETDAPDNQTENQDAPAAQTATVSEPQATQNSGNDLIVIAVQNIAKIRKEKGERGAVENVFACYKRARAKNVSVLQAQTCAAKDFVLSREIIAARPENATGTGDRALLVSKRHAERIGALLQFKGMSQRQFNTFAKVLHGIAEPEYKKARAS